MPDATATADPVEQGSIRCGRLCFAHRRKKTARPAPTPVWQMLEKLPLLRTSVLITLIMLLKVYPKNLFCGLELFWVVVWEVLPPEAEASALSCWCPPCRWIS